MYFSFLLPWGTVPFFLYCYPGAIGFVENIVEISGALFVILYGGRSAILIVEKIVNKCSPPFIAFGSVPDVPGNHILTVLSYKEARRGAELEAEGEGE